MESLHGLELDGTPTYQDLSKMVPLTPEELGPRMKKISISKSFLQMLHSAQGTIFVGQSNFTLVSVNFGTGVEDSH